jgi:hypothetical protein
MNLHTRRAQTLKFNASLDPDVMLLFLLRTHYILTPPIILRTNQTKMKQILHPKKRATQVKAFSHPTRCISVPAAASRWQSNGLALLLLLFHHAKAFPMLTIHVSFMLLLLLIHPEQLREK